MKPTYETPELTEVGKAQDVILGIGGTGDDSDMQNCMFFDEFAEESIEE
jgi:hypothetical protein